MTPSPSWKRRNVARSAALAYSPPAAAIGTSSRGVAMMPGSNRPPGRRSMRIRSRSKVLWSIPERPEQQIAHHRREWLAPHPFEDVAGEVDAEVRVRVAGADREPQPRVGDAPDMGLEVALIDVVLLPTGTSCVKTAVCASSIRSVIFRSGWSSNALRTVNFGR